MCMTVTGYMSSTSFGLELWTWLHDRTTQVMCAAHRVLTDSLLVRRVSAVFRSTVCAPHRSQPHFGFSLLAFRSPRHAQGLFATGSASCCSSAGRFAIGTREAIVGAEEVLCDGCTSGARQRPAEVESASRLPGAACRLGFASATAPGATHPRAAGGGCAACGLGGGAKLCIAFA